MDTGAVDTLRQHLQRAQHVRQAGARERTVADTCARIRTRQPRLDRYRELQPSIEDVGVSHGALTRTGLPYILRALRPLAIALTFTASVSASPTVVEWSEPALAVTVPDGFTRLAAQNPTADLLGTWRRDGSPGEGPLLLQFVHLGAVVPQRPLAGRELDELRASDPYPFTDSRERSRAFGFDLDTLVGRATVNGRSVVRITTAVPLVDDSVRVVVLGPSSREREAREVFRDVLASCRGETAWQTPWQRARETAQRIFALTAIALGVAYGALALAVFRRRDEWHRARVAALFVMGSLWLAVAALVPWGRWGALVRSLALAAAFLWHAARRRGQWTSSPR